MPTRRTALLTIAGAAASPLFSQSDATHVHPAAEPATAVLTDAPVYFKRADYAVVSRLTDLIIPRTDTPGALEAHVPYRIDREVAEKPELQQQFITGLERINAEAVRQGSQNFASLAEEKQIAILAAFSEQRDPFFEMVKGLTVDWYYRSEEGLVKELGFHGNTYRPDFPGCTHPEHWPSAEGK